MPAASSTTPRPVAGSISPAIALAHLLGIIVSWASVWALARVALGTRTGQWLDERALKAAHAVFGANDSSVGRLLRSALDLLPTAAVVVGVVALVVFTVRARRALPAIVGIAAFVASVASVQILKRWVIDKPNFAIHEAPMNSFPSGHTSLAAAAAMMVVLAAPARYRPATALIAAIVSAVAGASTVVNAWHRPSDAIAAIVITGGWGLLGGLVLCGSTGRASNSSTRFLVLWLGGLGLILLALSALLAWFAWTGPGAGTALLAGMLAISAGSALTWSLVALILQHR